MKYHDIRSSFKKCGVALTEDGVSLIFHKYEPPRWVTVDVNQKEFHNKDIFQSLVSTCDGIKLFLIPNTMVRLLFQMELPLETSVLYQPLELEMTTEEYEELILRTIPENETQYREFVEFLFKTQNDCDRDKIDGLLDFIEKHSAGKVIRMSRRKRWPVLKQSAELFSEESRLWIPEYCEPDEDIDFGVVEYYFEAQKPKMIRIGKEHMQRFGDLSSTAHGISLEAKTTPSKASFQISFLS